MVNHRYSTWFIVGLFVLMLVGAVTAIFTSEDIDEVCGTDNSTLYRWDGTWQCAELEDMIIVNTTIINITNNFSLFSNNTNFLNGNDSSDFVTYGTGGSPTATKNVDLGNQNFTTTGGGFFGNLSVDLPTAGTRLDVNEVSIVAGIIKMPEIVMTSNLGAVIGSIRETLYIRSVSSNPVLRFSNSDASEVADITYSPNVDSITFGNANGGYIFNSADVNVSENLNVKKNISVTEYLNVVKNVSADYFLGNGSQLTDLPQQFNNPFDQELNTTQNTTFMITNFTSGYITQIRTKSCDGSPPYDDTDIDTEFGNPGSFPNGYTVHLRCSNEEIIYQITQYGGSWYVGGAMSQAISNPS